MKIKGEQKAKNKKTIAIKSSLRAAPILVNTGTRAGKGAARKRRRMMKTKLTRHAAIFSTTYPPAQDMLQRIRQKAAAKLLQRAQEGDLFMEEKPSTTMLTMGSRADEQRSSIEERSGGDPSSSIAPTRLSREDLKQALLAKAADDKGKSISKMVPSKPSPTSTTSVTALRQGRLPDSSPSESNAIMRLLGR